MITDKLAQAAAAEIRCAALLQWSDKEASLKYLENVAAAIIARHYAPLVEAAEAFLTIKPEDAYDEEGFPTEELVRLEMRLRSALKGVRG